MSKKKKLVLEDGEVTQFIAMCFIVLEDCRGTVEGHTIHLGESVVEELLQRALKVTGNVK